MCLLALGCDSSSDAQLDIDPEGPLYAVASEVFTQQSVTGVVYLVSDLATVGEVPISEALPLGSGTIRAIPGEQAFLFMPFEQPTATRYDVTEDGNIVEGATVSALATGGSFLNAEAVSDSGKVWMTVFPQFRVLEIDPASMTIERELDLFSELDKGFPDPYMGVGTSAVRGNELYMGVYHRNFNDATAIPITEIVALDMATGEYDVLVDEDCPFGVPALAGNEIIVSGTNAFGASLLLSGTEGFERSCMKRIPAGQNSFEANFVRDLIAEANGAPAAEVVPVSASAALVRVFDPSLGPTPDEVESHFSYLNSDAWRWGRVSLDSPGAIEVLPGGTPSFGRVDRFLVDGEPWSFDFTDASGQSTLARLTEDGPVEGLTVNGFVYSIERI